MSGLGKRGVGARSFIGKLRFGLRGKVCGWAGMEEIDGRKAGLKKVGLGIEVRG